MTSAFDATGKSHVTLGPPTSNLIGTSPLRAVIIGFLWAAILQFMSSESIVNMLTYFVHNMRLCQYDWIFFTH